MNKILRIGTRASELALWQAEWARSAILRHYPDCSVELVKITTSGDKFLDSPLNEIGGKGLFIKEIEESLLAGSIDIAVHSMKDLPAEIPPGLVISAITKRVNPYDAFVSNQYACLQDLPLSSVVGTTSLRRSFQLKKYREDLVFKMLRGNINTRLAKLDQGKYDAIILAAAGLERLSFSKRIGEVLSQKVCLPAVGQGALGIEIKQGDEEIREITEKLHDQDTALCLDCERAFLLVMEGSCRSPIGGYATLAGDILRFEGFYASPDGEFYFREKVEGLFTEARKIGERLGKKFLQKMHSS